MGAMARLGHLAKKGSALNGAHKVWFAAVVRALPPCGGAPLGCPGGSPWHEPGGARSPSCVRLARARMLRAVWIEPFSAVRWPLALTPGSRAPR